MQHCKEAHLHQERFGRMLPQSMPLMSTFAIWASVCLKDAKREDGQGQPGLHAELVHNAASAGKATEEEAKLLPCSETCQQVPGVRRPTTNRVNAHSDLCCSRNRSICPPTGSYRTGAKPAARMWTLPPIHPPAPLTMALLLRISACCLGGSATGRIGFCKTNEPLVQTATVLFQACLRDRAGQRQCPWRQHLGWKAKLRC